MLRFILGRSGTGKTREMYRQIMEKIKNGCDRLIVLIPDQISLETEKEMLSLLGAPDKQKVNVFGFNKLCRFVYEQTSNPPKAPVDNGTRAAHLTTSTVIFACLTPAATAVLHRLCSTHSLSARRTA